MFNTNMPNNFNFGGGFGGGQGPPTPFGGGFGGSAGIDLKLPFMSMPLLKNRTGVGGGVLLGAGAIGMGATTGFNPYSVVPSPWQGALYGGFIFNPIKAAAVTSRGLWGSKAATPGKFGSMKFSGALGWKTMLLGVSDSSSIWARMSLGNAGLSTVEMASKAFASVSGISDTPLMSKLTNARQLGIAGMFNIGTDPKDALKHGWLYKLAGIDPSNLEYMDLKKFGMQGKFVASVSDDAISRGLMLTGKAASVGSRAFMTAAGAFSLYSWYSVFRDIGAMGATSVAEGIGDAARMLFQFTDELKKPEFGTGRVPMAMASGAAATERQRAIRASYSSKISPQNRMYGNEAMYHHSR